MASLERDRIPSPRPVATKETQLIDRSEEMRLLREAADRAVKGMGGVVFLYGEAGIGKTRLTRELEAYARLCGMQVLYGRCPALFRMDGVPPYVLWSEVIKDYLHSCTPEQLYKVIGLYPGELFKLVPEIRQKLRGVIPESLPIIPEHGRDRLFEAVSQFVTSISKEAPLLVILDDLQWTDQTSLLLLHYLARGVYREPLLLLGAYRDTDVDDKHPLTPVLTELNRERLLQSAQLKRMSFDDTSEMIKRVLEQDDVPREFCQLIYEKTRGNPFFAEEVIKSLKEEGVIIHEDKKWKIKDVSKIEFPKTVKSVIEARIARLDDESQNVLTLASFVGNDFTLEAMSALAGIQENKLLELMDALLKTGLIKEQEVRGEGVCSFSDILVRDVVYEEVSLLKRRRLHGDVGRALEKVYAKTTDEHLGELALHFLESGDKEKALDYFLKAGEKAAGVYANTEATSYLKSALRLLEDREDRLQQKGHVLERLGDIKKLAGEPKECIKYWNEALMLRVKLQEKERSATLHRKMANVLWDLMGDVEGAEQHHDAGLEILEAQPKSVELARLYIDKAHMDWRNGNVPKARSWAEKALALAEKLNALEVVADCCNELSALIWFAGDFKKCREYASRALKIALENNYLETAVWAYYRVAGSLPPQEYVRYLENYEKGLALAKKIGDTSGQSMHLDALSVVHVDMGELDRAIALGEEATALSRRSGTVQRLASSLIGLAYAYHRAGDWNKSEQCSKEVSNIPLSEYNLIAWNKNLLGLAHLDKEEYAKAKESFEEALKVIEKAEDRAGYFWNSPFLIWTLITLDEIGMATNLLDKLRWFYQETEEKWVLVYEMALRSMLLRAEKKYDESISLFEKTLKEWESTKANIWNAYWFARLVLYEYAQAYNERGESVDREKALSLLNRALEMFQKMGAKKDIEKVEAKIAFIETGREVLKPKPIERVATGYADLDELLYGGLPSSYAVVLTSPSCSESDWLIKNFLGRGAKLGEATFYVTINPGSARTLVEEFPLNFQLFVCNPQADAIVKDAPNVVKLKGVENLTDISIALTSAIHKLDSSLKGPRRICIGLVSDVLLQHHAVQTRKWLAGLIPELQAEGFTTLAVIDPQVHPSEELHAILGVFDGEINVREKETEKGLERYLRIKKMSNQKYLENELLLKKD